jgi:hypothetical protein
MAPNLKDDLARVDLFHLGTFRMADERPRPQQEATAKVVAELCCERMAPILE